MKVSSRKLTQYPVSDFVPTQSFSTVRNSYLTRSFFESQFIESRNGSSAFLTLTFNNSSLIHIGSQNYLNNSAFQSFLKSLREYCSRLNHKLSYFCTCEFGEGKGSRGLNNNPHYHCLFFFYPLSSSTAPLTSYQFMAIVKNIWCFGSYYSISNSLDSFVHSVYSDRSSPKSYRFGIVSASKSGVSVTSSCISYVSKYITKSSVLLPSLKTSLFNSLVFLIDSHSFTNSGNHLPSPENRILFNKKFRSLSVVDSYSILFLIERFYSFFDFSNLSSRDIVNFIFYYFKNRLLPKVFISNSYGLDGINHIVESNGNLRFKFTVGVKSYNISLPTYYYRKLFYDYVTYTPYSQLPFYKSTIYYKNDEFCNHVLTHIPSIFNSRLYQTSYLFLPYLNQLSSISSLDDFTAKFSLNLSNIKAAHHYVVDIYERCLTNLKQSDFVQAFPYFASNISDYLRAYTYYSFVRSFSGTFTLNTTFTLSDLHSSLYSTLDSIFSSLSEFSISSTPLQYPSCDFYVNLPYFDVFRFLMDFFKYYILLSSDNTYLNSFSNSQIKKPFNVI